MILEVRQRFLPLNHYSDWWELSPFEATVWRSDRTVKFVPPKDSAPGLFVCYRDNEKISSHEFTRDLFMLLRLTPDGHRKVAMKNYPLVVYLPDCRDVEIGRFGCGNAKLGAGVFTYSRPAGNRAREIAMPGVRGLRQNPDGTCPGSTDECEAICYAKRIDGPVREVYESNCGDDVPVIPQAAKLLRLHVSGDFDNVQYIEHWIDRIAQRPDVLVWAYTRSWRVPELLHTLNKLRALPNVQLFASVDPSTADLPPVGWRRAWIWRGSVSNGSWPVEWRLSPLMKTGWHVQSNDNMTVIPDGAPAYVCPEESGRRRDCVACGYCFEGQKHDVVFLEH